MLTIPNQNKRLNFRRTSALASDTESVLARLGPDAVAFLQSQQEAELRAAAAAAGCASPTPGSQVREGGSFRDLGGEMEVIREMGQGGWTPSPSCRASKGRSGQGGCGGSGVRLSNTGISSK